MLAVPQPRVRLATGGLAVPAKSPSGRPLTIQIGAETIEGLIAPEDVADRLVKAATKRRMLSAGRRPNWARA